MLVVHLESGRVELRRQPLPRVPEGFARIRLLAAGICSTDLELQRGYYGFTERPATNSWARWWAPANASPAKSISPAGIANGAHENSGGIVRIEPCSAS